MAELHLHLSGPAADHAEWAIGPADDTDDFDEAALERAIRESRAQAYEALRDIDAA